MESHAARVGRALAAGKHVFVEKPLATSSSDARRAAAAAGDRILFVGHVYLYHPLLHGVRNVPVRSTSSTWRKHGTFDSDLFWNLASHDVSIALSLFGEVPAQIEVPMSERDRARIRLGFSGGRDAFIDIDRTSSERSKTLELNGTMVLDLTQGDPLQRELDAFAAAVERSEGRTCSAPPPGSTSTGCTAATTIRAPSPRQRRRAMQSAASARATAVRSSTG
jgi:hypothetical protein